MVLSRVAVANLSVGTWVRDTSFVVMAMSRYDVILGMQFLYNAEVLYIITYLAFGSEAWRSLVKSNAST